MKLLRYGPQGQERPGLLDSEGRIRDLSGQIDDLHAQELSDDLLNKLRSITPESLPLVEGKPRIGVPLSGIRQCVAIGLNYRKHALEAAMEIPAEPLVFFKAITSLCGPNDDTLLPGDVILTGTPEGVGWAMKPRRMLREGDHVHLSIAGLGEQDQQVIAFKAPPEAN